MSQQINHFENRQVVNWCSIFAYPRRPSANYNFKQGQPIQEYVGSYHSHQCIQLEDHIQFYEQQEYLKRFYNAQEHETKIELLGDYYKFHEEIPRLFMENIGRLMETNTEEKRLLQFNKVSKYNKHNEHKLLPLTTRIQPQPKLLKDIELSYDNFENKQTKKPKKNSPNRTIKRVISVQGEKGIGFFKHGKYPKNHSKPNKGIKPIQAEKLKKTQSKKIIKIQSHKPSANNSLASQKNLSRSKSKTNLHGLQARKFNAENPSQKKFKGSNIYSANNSHQNSFAKLTERQGNTKSRINVLQCQQKNVLKEVQKNIIKRKEQKKVVKQVSTAKPRQLKVGKVQEGKQKEGKGMFKKVIEIRNRCI